MVDFSGVDPKPSNRCTSRGERRRRHAEGKVKGWPGFMLGRIRTDKNLSQGRGERAEPALPSLLGWEHWQHPMCVGVEDGTVRVLEFTGVDKTWWRARCVTTLVSCHSPRQHVC